MAEKVKSWRSDVRLGGGVEGEEEGALEARGDEAPFDVLVIGDFGQGGVAPAERRLAKIDRDDFDDEIARFRPAWKGDVRSASGTSATQVALSFRALDDFHPDRIIAEIPSFRKIVDARRALDDPKRFEKAASEILAWTPRAAAGGEERKPAPRRTVRSGELLDSILDDAGGDAPAPVVRNLDSEVEKLIEDVVAPHLVEVDKGRQERLVEAVDRGLSEALRLILHQPEFQRLEAAWRGLRWLLDRIESEGRVRLRILHLTRDELEQDLRAGARSVLRSQVVEPASVPGSDRPALLVGLYDFGHEDEDIAVLASLGAIASRVGAVFVAGAAPRILGCESFTELPSAKAIGERTQSASFESWSALRSSALAGRLALALPRWLCRLPYGADTEPIESFAFEEHGDGSHEGLLWAHPGFAVVAVVADAFRSEGWDLDFSSEARELEGLPLYVYDESGEKQVKPCAEVFLSEPTVIALEETGLLPLVSYRGQDRILLRAIQSLATPRAPLSFRH